MFKSLTSKMILLIVVVSFVMGVVLYPYLPGQVASHWNIRGEVDGYMSKFWGAFLMPIISTVMAFLFVMLPKLDPLGKNIEKFRKYYENFILVIIGFLFYLYILTIVWNLGVKFDMVRLMTVALAGLVYYAGVLIEKAERNWFIGIRTPWTLSSDVVWKDTHKLGGKLFKISGGLALLGVIVPSFAFWLVIAPIVISALYLVVYSYMDFTRKRA